MDGSVLSDAQTLAMARHLVERMAPEELDLFEETAALVRQRTPRRGKRRDDPLGFGLVETSEVVFTSLACDVAREVVKSLAEQAGAATAGRVMSWFRNRRRAASAPVPGDPVAGGDEGGGAGGEGGDADAGPATAAPLSPQRLDEVRGIARRRAVLLGLPPDRAELLAESVVEYLNGLPGRPA